MCLQWVQCDKCEGWQHQICALFNDKRDMIENAKYICPICYLKEIEANQCMSLPKDAFSGAKDLPSTMLSNHIEQRLFSRLEQERKERASAAGKNFGEVRCKHCSMMMHVRIAYILLMHKHLYC